ncbi:Septin and tuftelin-interacting protein 1 -like protein [Toxocara canis]|uniref:Septin and tuftelin-interacting protein 1-like protein n=1 Tax=Toxocara canis TaxID=6265 RepID=A0A0B2W2D4_TOXCA|nr:Septin and tuftelin-interacting protein 1 -like protein [Toxocara canis]
MNIDPDEEEDMERFEISDRDIEFAINPGARRGLSKSQQLYGIWGDREESEDEEDMRAGFGSSSSRKRAKNYSAPVAFVSGGVKQGNRIEGESKDSEEGDEPIRIERRSRPSRPQMGANVFAGLRSSAIHSTVDPEKFADWAKHSKSDVIMRMMRNMGYVPGQGLGAKKQGIVEPVQAVLRPGRAAIGAYGKEAKGPKFGESAADAQRRTETIEETTTGGVRRGNWKKSGARKGVTYQFKTIDEVIAEGGTLRKRLEMASAGIKVIDMTGKEQKVYSGYEAYAAKTRAVAETEKEQRVFDVPELTYNLNALLDMTEDTIRRNNHQLRFLEDQTTALENDRNQLNVALAKERDEQKRMKEVLAMLEGFSSGVDNGCELTLERCRELFEKLQTYYLEEYRLFNLEEVAVASVLPLVQQHFSSWDPLDKGQVDYGYSLMTEWKKILESEERCMLGTTKSLENLTPFERLLWDGWMPSIRRAALRWNPRDDANSMLTVIGKWLSLLPIWMRENLLEQVIIPRISSQVDEWNPLADHVPIHTWMHPWLDVMGDRLQPVFSPIRQKLAKALREWNPTDHSALSMLRPWKGVFAAATMSAFLAQNVTPKLERALREMDYDPTKNKRYDEFYATLAWVEMLGSENIAAIFVRSFFPKWYETLCVWLEAPGVVMEEVALWYNEWKARFPIDISSLHIVREQLMRALLAMNQAQQGLHVNRQPAPMPPPVSSMPIMPGGPLPPRPPLPPLSHLSFKDVVEMRARQAGVVYAPQGNKFYDGKRVFTFGRMSIYLDRNVIFAFNVEAQQWAPIALDHLLSIC